MTINEGPQADMIAHGLPFRLRKIGFYDGTPRCDECMVAALDIEAPALFAKRQPGCAISTYLCRPHAEDAYPEEFAELEKDDDD